MVALTFLLSCAALSFLPAIQADTPHAIRHAEHRRATGDVDLQKRAPGGRFDFFVPGFSVPLISTVGLNGKIYFMDKKYDPGNTTGSYELDPSLVNGPVWQNAWRTLHVNDEIFCSASLVLPDKTGRILNIAGWSDAALYGVRLITPDAPQGVTGNTDWQQDLNNAALQRPRWYPTGLMLSNGSILVVGGTDTNSGNAQPNLEVLPRIPGGDTTVYLDWLARTHPFNLYPFLFVLPSSNVFTVFYNEARILDKTTFATVSVMPMVPGPGPGDFDGGRTYPYAGVGLILPIKAPWTAPATILVCGGSRPSNQNGLSTCVSISPEVANPQWTVEYMPSPRVLACMAPLADGTFLIVNGAKQGVAGFASATNPNLVPVVYNPALPIGARMTELAGTPIARLYHSESSLMLDGSVLISGSDPRDPNFPQEYRHERLLPPYLLNGQIRPGFSLPNRDWAYKLGYQIVLKGTASTNMRIVLIGAASSTHGNTMATRTLLPAQKCTGFSCTVYAPTNSGVCPPGWFMLFVLDGPTPSLGAWVRIGGDPAQLGNWPPGPAFTRPGL